MSDKKFKDWNIFLKFAVLAVIFILALLFGVFFTLLIGMTSYGMNLQEVAKSAQNADFSNINIGFVRVLLFFTTPFPFILTSLIWSSLNRTSVKDYFHFAKIKPANLVWIGIFAFALMGPIITYLVHLSESMGMQSNNQNQELMKLIMDMPDFGSLIANLVLIALVTAIGEEMFFRGIIQKELLNTIKLPWLAILLSSLIFSAIHGDPNMLLSRTLMGIMLGVMYYTSRSIWLPILAHFVNNASAVVASYLYQHHSSLVKTNPLEEDTNVEWYLALLSLILFGLMIEFVYKRRRIKENTFTELNFPS